MPEPISAQIDAANAAAAPAPTTPSTPPSTPTPSPTPTPSAATPSTPAASVSAASASTPGAPTTPAVPQVPSWLSSLREKGIDLGNDEAGALGKLAELHGNYSKLAPLVPYVQQYMQHAPQFSKFLAEQQRAPAPAPDANAPFYSKYWNPPEWNPAWERMLTTDASGNVTTVPGAPPELVPKYLAYKQFRAEQAEKFLQNPHEYLKDTISHLAREEAQKIVQQQFGQVDTRRTVSDFMEQNSNWLHDRDQSGQVVMQAQFNPQTGQYVQIPKLSQWGAAFADYVREEANYQAQNGLPQDVSRQRDVAMHRIRGDYAIWKLNNPTNGGNGTPTAQAPAAPAMTPQQAANQIFLQQNNPAAGIPPAGGNSNPAPAGPTTRRNFNDMLRENMKRNGITDEVIRNSN